jgi:hypothetical protein
LIKVGVGMEELKFEFSDIGEVTVDDLDLVLDNIGEVKVDDLDLVLDDIGEVKVKTNRKRVPKNYINNQDFLQALTHHKEATLLALRDGKAKPRIPDYVGECFMKLAEGLSRRPNFYGYSFRDEMVSDGIENCLMYLNNFDPTKQNSRGYVNAFGYFTHVLWWCFVRRIQKEKKQQYIKYKATENFGILDEAELLELGDGQIKQLEVYDNMYSYIQKFEEAELKKAQKAITAKKPKICGIECFLE